MSRWITLFTVLLVLAGCDGNNSEFDQPDDNNPPDNDLPSTLVLNIVELDEETILLEWNRPSELTGEVNYKIFSGWVRVSEISVDRDVVSLRLSPIPNLGEITVEAWQGDSRMILRADPDAISSVQ